MQVIKVDTKYDLYDKAYGNLLEVYKSNPMKDKKLLMKKLILYGVKMINGKSNLETVTKEEAEFDFNFLELIKTGMAAITPIDFVNIFPIEKNYDGQKHEIKDYFYTRDYITGLEQDTPIGKEVDTFLWEYNNKEIIHFNVKLMKYISNLRQLQGKPSLGEEWADSVGIKTFTRHMDDKGTEFMLDKETGRTAKFTKSNPRYLKILK